MFQFLFASVDSILGSELNNQCPRMCVPLYRYESNQRTNNIELPFRNDTICTLELLSGSNYNAIYSLDPIHNCSERIEQCVSFKETL